MTHTHPAIQQVYDLGYKDGDQLNVILFAGKGFQPDLGDHGIKGSLVVGEWGYKGKDEKGGWVTRPDGLDYLKTLNDMGFGVYLTVNKGGTKAPQITDCVALFYEEDHKSKEEQWELLNRMPVEPSAVIDTRNSLHVYYTFPEPIRDKEAWGKAMIRLIELMESDKTIKNPNRLMRLAGFDHQAKGLEPYPITVAHRSTNRYSLDELTSYLPEIDEPKRQSPRLVNASSSGKMDGDLSWFLEAVVGRIDPGQLFGELDGWKGHNRNAWCPFCTIKEKAPSFNVNADKGVYFCYGCEASGNYITWLKSNNYSGKEAIERLSQLSGVPIPTFEFEQTFSVEIKKDLSEENILSKLSKFALKLWRSTPITTIKNGGTKQTKLILKEDYAGEIIEFAKGNGPRIYEEAARLGYKYILDCSPTGAGKTHTVGRLRTKSFFVFEDEEDDSFKRLIYFSQQPRNPNSSVIETDFFEMPTRNKGYQLNYDKLTPAGNPTRTKLEDPDTEPELRTKATCHLANLFLDCYQKGHDPKGICGGCEHFSKCKTERGEGYGYLYLTKEIKTQDKIHAHLRGVPEKLLDENVVAIVDESEMAEWTTGVEVTEKDIRIVFKKLKEANPGLYKKLLGVKDVLLEFYDETTNKAPRWGWKMADIVEKFNGELDGIDDDLEAIKEFEANSRPEIAELLKGVELHQNFLYDLLAILLKRKPGSLSAGNQTMVITTRNQRMIDSLKACHCAIFQDATHSREQLSIALGVPEDEVLVIRQESKEITNLTVRQYVGAGKLGNQRSKDETERAVKIREYFAQTHAEMGFIEFKAHSKPEDLIHGGDGRGSNAFQHKTHVCSIGLYRPNMGAVLNEYQALTGTIVDFGDEGFRRYYSHKVASTVQQETGRLRANRRPDEDLFYHVIAEGDLSFLEDLGIKLEIIDIGTINPEFCTIENRVQARNQAAGLAFIKEWGLDAWLELSQNKFAYSLGITAQALGQWCKKYLGNFERFKEMVAAIFNPQPKPDLELEADDQLEVEILASTLIPSLVDLQVSNREFSEGIKDFISPFKWANVLEAIQRLPLSKSIRLLFRILRVCKESYATC